MKGRFPFPLFILYNNKATIGLPLHDERNDNGNPSQFFPRGIHERESGVLFPSWRMVYCFTSGFQRLRALKHWLVLFPALVRLLLGVNKKNQTTTEEMNRQCLSMFDHFLVWNLMKRGGVDTIAHETNNKGLEKLAELDFENGNPPLLQCYHSLHARGSSRTALLFSLQVRFGPRSRTLVRQQ